MSTAPCARPSSRRSAGADGGDPLAGDAAGVRVPRVRTGRHPNDVAPSATAKSPLGEALSGITRYRGRLGRCPTDGRVEIDSNTVERTIRPIARTRRNALFAGRDAGAEYRAVIASPIDTCKMNAVNPPIRLTETLTSIVHGNRPGRIGNLISWNDADKVRSAHGLHRWHSQARSATAAAIPVAGNAARRVTGLVIASRGPGNPPRLGGGRVPCRAVPRAGRTTPQRPGRSAASWHFFCSQISWGSGGKAPGRRRPTRPQPAISARNRSTSAASVDHEVTSRAPSGSSSGPSGDWPCGIR